MKSAPPPPPSLSPSRPQKTHSQTARILFKAVSILKKAAVRKWNLLSAEWANSTDSKLSVPSSICTQTWTSFMTCRKLSNSRSCRGLIQHNTDVANTVHVNSDRSASQGLLNSFPATFFPAGAKMLHSSINQTDGQSGMGAPGPAAHAPSLLLHLNARQNARH